MMSARLAQLSQLVFDAFAKNAYIISALPAILAYLQQDYILSEFSSRADELKAREKAREDELKAREDELKAKKNREEQRIKDIKEAFRTMKRTRNEELRNFLGYLTKIHETLHAYNFEFDVVFIKEILDDELTSTLNGKPFVGTIREFIKAIFIMNASLRGEKAGEDYAENMFRFEDEDSAAAMVDNEDDYHTTNYAVLFLVELMCKDAVDISFRIQVSDEDIENAIKTCLNPKTPSPDVPKFKRPYVWPGQLTVQTVEDGNVVNKKLKVGQSFRYFPPENKNELPTYGKIINVPLPSAVIERLKKQKNKTQRVFPKGKTQYQKEHAATKIQKIARGIQARQTVKSLRTDKKLKKSQIEAKKRTIKINANKKKQNKENLKKQLEQNLQNRIAFHPNFSNTGINSSIPSPENI